MTIRSASSESATTPPADAVHNVIIQNLTFRNASDDSNERQNDCSSDATGFALYCAKTRNSNRSS